MVSARYCLDVPPEGAGQRLDRWLGDVVADVSRSRVQKLIRQGQVRLNGRICQQKNDLLQAGDRVDLDIPDPVPVELAPEVIPLDVLYEDDELLVVNKPKGLVVHPGAGHASGTLVNALMAHCDRLSGINGEQRPGIVHRLDKDTSGALVVAKSDRAHRHLQAQIQAKTARRTYLGITFGRPRAETGTVTAPIGRHPRDRQKMAVVDESKGRHAVTHWRVLETWPHFALLRFDLETGRTHQIRVHAVHLGHPIVGDPIYSSARSKLPVKLTGQALHAWQLSFIHPTTGEVISVTAPPPDEFERFLQRARC
ncbi:MAG: RluA family pseudouridine synthase [Cyanobacteria bacterium P01_D01_bin.123]